MLEPCDAKVSRTVLRGLGVSNGARPLARKFRAPDVVGRKPVRFLLQENSGLSIPAGSKSGQFKVRTGKGKTKRVAASRDGQERYWALPVEEIEQAKSRDFHLPI